MIPFSLLPHWFQRRYRVWRCWLAGLLFRDWRRACCRWNKHRMVVREMPHSGFTEKEKMPFGVGALVFFCVDCKRATLLGDVVPGSNHTHRSPT